MTSIFMLANCKKIFWIYSTLFIVKILTCAWAKLWNICLSASLISGSMSSNSRAKQVQPNCDTCKMIMIHLYSFIREKLTKLLQTTNWHTVINIFDHHLYGVWSVWLWFNVNKFYWIRFSWQCLNCLLFLLNKLW